MKFIESFEKYFFFIILGIYSVFVLPFFSAPIVIPREALLAFGVCLLLILWIVKSIWAKSIAFHSGKVDLAVALIITSYLLSTLLATPNKMEAFLLPGVTTFVVLGAALYFLLNQFKNGIKETFTIPLIISGVLLSILILFIEVQILNKISFLPSFIKDPSFNLLGGTLPTFIYLLTLLPLSVGTILSQKDMAKKLFFGVSAALIVLGVSISTKNMFPGQALYPKLNPLKTSWEISVETLKTNPLWGVGPANYLTAFNRFRPVSFNQTDIWPLKFTTARNFYLTMVTELGLVGVFAFTILLVTVYKLVVKGLDFTKASLLTLLLLFAIFPGAPIMIPLLFILFALSFDSSEKTITYPLPRTAVVLTTLPILLGVGLFAFFGHKALLAEQKFRMAIDALSRNEAKATYDNMREAINFSPKVDRYHASLAQVDIALASGIASKKNLSESDKQTITQLIQQAISEGKLSINLNPQRSSNWEVLARIYRSIMPFAQGADNFAIQTFTQAIALDPVNPNLRIALGGTYYALGRFDEAIEAFKLATLAKPDFANAHYNLSAAYREKKEWDKAINEMNIVLSLVKKDSADYNQAKTELDNLEKNKPVKTSEATENLNPPQPVEKPVITPPITLPEDSNPPQ